MTTIEKPPMPKAMMRISGSTTFRNIHRFLLRASGGRIGSRINGMETLLLTTTGRKSGSERTVPLLSLPDGDARVVVATNSGADTNPAWWHNLQADPNATVEVGGERHRVRARSATSEEAARLWPVITETNEVIAYYPQITDRRMPMVYLEPVR